jgi:hypothetical protein
MSTVNPNVPSTLSFEAVETKVASTAQAALHAAEAALASLETRLKSLLPPGGAAALTPALQAAVSQAVKDMFASPIPAGARSVADLLPATAAGTVASLEAFAAAAVAYVLSRAQPPTP